MGINHVSAVLDKAVNLNHIFHPLTKIDQEAPPSLANRVGAVALLVLALIMTLGTLTGFYLYHAHRKVIYEKLYQGLALDGLQRGSKEGQEARVRVASLSEEQFQQVVRQNFRDVHFYWTPNEHLNHLDYASMTTAQIEALFSRHDRQEITTARLELLTEDNFKTVLTKLSPWQFRFIPASRFHLIDWKTLSQKQLVALFPLVQQTDSRVKFVTLSSQQLLDCFDQLDARQLLYMTNKQLKDPQLCAKYDALIVEQYTILGLTKTATLTEVEESYRTAAGDYYSGKIKEERFRPIEAAYETLFKNPLGLIAFNENGLESSGTSSGHIFPFGFPIPEEKAANEYEPLTEKGKEEALKVIKDAFDRRPKETD